MLVDPFFLFALVTFDTYHHYEIENNENMNRSTFHKLDDEFKRGTINLETYNSEIDNNIKLIQDATSAIYDDQ